MREAWKEKGMRRGREGGRQRVNRDKGFDITVGIHTKALCDLAGNKNIITAFFCNKTEAKQVEVKPEHNNFAVCPLLLLFRLFSYVR